MIILRTVVVHLRVYLLFPPIPALPLVAQQAVSVAVAPVTPMEDADKAAAGDTITAQKTTRARTPPLPRTPSPSSSRQSTQLGTVDHASVSSVTPPPTSAPLVSIPAVPAPAPVGNGFAASLSYNRFASLALSTHIFNPTTHNTTEQAATVDSDFTFELATSQGIPPT
jgi:hypothetical protein